VNSAARAREVFQIHRPDLIMADIGMPDEDGYSLLTSLRCIEREQGAARVPAIAVTAYARREDRQRALAAGFDDHLNKPVDPERLMAVLAKLVHEVKRRS
jgi:CheY-like chemotaxis protein